MIKKKKIKDHPGKHRIRPGLLFVLLLTPENSFLLLTMVHESIDVVTALRTTRLAGVSLSKSW